MGKAQVDAQDFIESDYCNIQSENGEITVNGIKTGSLALQSVTGDIVLGGTIQGNVVVSSNGGNIIGEKRFLGPSLEVTTVSGDIRVASCYSDSSKFATDRGDS